MDKTAERTKTMRLLERAKRGYERASKNAKEYADEVEILTRALESIDTLPQPAKKA